MSGRDHPQRWRDRPDDEKRKEGRKPTRASLDGPHEENRLSLVRALDARLAITDPLGGGHTATNDLGLSHLKGA